MKKILLDFAITKTPEQVQDYLALQFGFPDYYGKNLDALYDMLTDICEPTCVGVFEDREGQEAEDYIRKVKWVLRDACEDNPNLGVIYGTLEDNL